MLDWRRALGEAVAGGAAEVRFAEPMARHTTFRIGGLADAWVCVNDRQALARVLEVCRASGVRYWVLGRGSNVLISDQGLRGVVITLGGELAQVRIQGVKDSRIPAARPLESSNPGIISAGAGASLDEVATFAEKEGLTGVEFLAGIPGTVGGGLHSNAGAFGRSLGDIVTSVTAVSAEGAEQVLASAQLRREYRRPMIGDGLIAVEVTMELEVKSQSSTPDSRFTTPADVREQRWAKHPKEPSAGSYFRNPETGAGQRIPAGRLIEQCGLKGRTIGGAKVSEKHANFLVNAGKARFADVYELAQVVKAAVEQETGILLEEEVQYLPGPGNPVGQKSEGRGQTWRS